MDRRKKRTSTNQYMMYISMMENDPIFASGRVPRDIDVNYLQKKWKELSDKLNTCSSGPTLTAEEWRKRLNDWKNTTRCKYRRSLTDEKDVQLTSLEMKALELFGKVPITAPTSMTEQLSIHLKSEKHDPDDGSDHQRVMESPPKDLQAVVDEACRVDDEEEDENDMQDLADPLATTSQTSTGNNTDGIATYRTIVVENAHYAEDDHTEEQLEFITHRRHPVTVSAGPATVAVNVPTVATAVQTVVTTTPTTVTKLINGEIPLKRLRSQGPDQVIYEVKKAPIIQQHPTTRNITIHNTNPGLTARPLSSNNTIISGVEIGSHEVRDLSRQIKRLADIKAEKLRFEVARFKFNNPGFDFQCQHNL